MGFGSGTAYRIVLCHWRVFRLPWSELLRTESFTVTGVTYDPMGILEVDSAVAFGLLTMVSWGIWLVLGNAASESMDPKTAAAISYLVATILAVVFVFGSGASLAITPRGGMLAGVAGVFAGVGFVSMYVGLSRGSTTLVSTLGAMYFVVAAVIGMAVLGDEITPTRVAGILFAGAAVILVTK
jgi:transporter family protein